MRHTVDMDSASEGSQPCAGPHAHRPPHRPVPVQPLTFWPVPGLRPRTPDARAVRTKKQRRPAIARETPECRPKLRRFAHPNLSLIASAPSTGEPSNRMIRRPGMPGNASGGGRMDVSQRWEKRWSASIAMASARYRNEAIVAVQYGVGEFIRQPSNCIPSRLPSPWDRANVGSGGLLGTPGNRSIGVSSVCWERRS